MRAIGVWGIIALAINMFLFLGQVAIDDIGPGGVDFFNPDGTLIGDLDSGNYTLNQSIDLPEDEGGVGESTGNFITDTFSAVKSWFAETTGLAYANAFINAVPNFLKVLGLPAPFVFGVGALWKAFMLLVVIGFLTGRMI